jgi:cytoskeleton protein RodZ
MQVSEAIQSSESDAAESADNLGVRLRQAREAQELSVDAVAAELRISAKALTALEECRFESLGPAVFAKGYLKQYGARLGLDVAGLLADYQRTAGDPGIEIAPSKAIKLRDERQILFWIAACVVLLLIAGGLAAWWWLGRDEAAAATATTTTAGSVAASPRRDPVAAPAASSPPAAREARNDVGAARREARAGPAETAETPAATVPPAASAASTPTGPMLEISFVEDSWADITDEAGERLYYGLGRAGTVATIPADRNLNLFFGYANGVTLRIDGEPVPIPASARRRGDLAQFKLEARTTRDP